MSGAGFEIDGIGASIIAASISTAGIFSIALLGSRVERLSGYISAFAVGLLTTAVMLHLVPEAFSYSMNAISWMLGAFAIMVGIGLLVQATSKNASEGAALTFGYASIIALSLHSFLDGVIYAAAFHDAPFTGWITTAGLLLHEFPEGVIAFFMLIAAGFSAVRAILFSFLAAALTTVLGAVAGETSFENAAELPMAAILGSAAGALIFVIIFHLSPHAARSPDARGYLFAQAGVIVGVLAIILNSLNGGHAGHAH